MATPDVTQKSAIYHSLAQLNCSFAAIVGTLETLQKAGAITAKYRRLFQGFAQEIQAEFNLEVLEGMDSIEMADWARFGKIRAKWEKYLRGPEPKRKGRSTNKRR